MTASPVDQVVGGSVAARGQADASWLASLMTASAVALIVLLPLEMVSWLLVTDVATHTADTVAQRWDSPWWRVTDLAFLVLALAHGTIGAVRLIGSTLRSPAGRSAWVGGVLTFAVTIGALASYSLLTYEVT